MLDSMGSDLTVVNAARVSFHKTSSEFDVAKDSKLISYLAKHQHWTPFAHCFASFHVKVPMFVAMQLDKHTVGLVTNSVSRRYVDDEPEYYLPSSWRSRPDSSIKQGSGKDTIDKIWWIEDDSWYSVEDGVKESMAVAHRRYTRMVECGVAPEQARMVLPMNTMTERIWSGSLAAFARVCKLRLDPHAQQEIQEVAQMVDAALQPLFPVSWEALKGN